MSSTRIIGFDAAAAANELPGQDGDLLRTTNADGSMVPDRQAVRDHVNNHYPLPTSSNGPVPVGHDTESGQTILSDGSQRDPISGDTYPGENGYRRTADDSKNGVEMPRPAMMQAQLFHTRSIMSSVLVSLLLMAGGCVQTDHRDQPVTVPSLPAYAVLKLASGDRHIDQVDLVAIQQELVAALQRQVPEADYAILAEETRQAACFIGPDHVARIGLWTLQVRTGEPALVRQQLPRAPVMLSHVAHLTEKDGRWNVRSLAVEKLRGR